MTTSRKFERFSPTRRQALALGAGAMALAAAPRLTRAAPPSKPTGQVIIGFSQEPTVFNPHLLHIEVDEGVHFNLFDPLFNVMPDGSFQPALAVEVPTIENGGVSADGTRWRVKLRDDVTWHDGTRFTAEDVKFTLELQANPDFRAARRIGHDLVRNIVVSSPTEISWEMEKPYAPYHAILAWTFMVPKHAFDGVDPNEAPFNRAPIGTGPFNWVSRTPGDNIVLEANETYWGEGPYLQRVIFKYIPDLTVLYTQFKTGDIDVCGLQGITADHYQEASTLPDRVAVIAPSSAVETVSFNLGLPQFQDKAVRHALYAGLDKNTIIDALYYGLRDPIETYMPKQSAYHNPDLPAHVFDTAKANKMLDAAGWVRGGDGVREKDGVRLEFDCSTTAGNHIREQMQQFMQQTWGEIGVKMGIANLPPAVMWGEHWMQSQYQAAIAGISFLTGPDPDTSDYFRASAINAQGGAGQNTWQYENAEVDTLLIEGGTTIDIATRKEIYSRIQEIIREDLPFLPVFQYSNIRGHKAGLEGFEININTRIETWNVRQWYWA